MPLHIIDPKAETLASELARKTGESIPEAVVHALEARLEKLREIELRFGTDRGESAPPTRRRRETTTSSPAGPRHLSSHQGGVIF